MAMPLHALFSAEGQPAVWQQEKQTMPGCVTPKAGSQGYAGVAPSPLFKVIRRCAKWRVIVRPEFTPGGIELPLTGCERQRISGKAARTPGTQPLQKAILFYGLQDPEFETDDKANLYWHSSLRVGRRVRRHLKKRFAYWVIVNDIFLIGQ